MSFSHWWKTGEGWWGWKVVCILGIIGALGVFVGWILLMLRDDGIGKLAFGLFIGVSAFMWGSSMGREKTICDAQRRLRNRKAHHRRRLATLSEWPKATGQQEE